MPSLESPHADIERDFMKFSPKERRTAEAEMQVRLALRMFGGGGGDADSVMMGQWTEGRDSMSKRFRDLVSGHPDSDFLKRFMAYGTGPFDGPSSAARVRNGEPCTFEQEQVLNELEELLRDHVPQSPS